MRHSVLSRASVWLRMLRPPLPKRWGMPTKVPSNFQFSDWAIP